MQIGPRPIEFLMTLTTKKNICWFFSNIYSFIPETTTWRCSVEKHFWNVLQNLSLMPVRYTELVVTLSPKLSNLLEVYEKVIPKIPCQIHPTAIHQRWQNLFPSITILTPINGNHDTKKSLEYDEIIWLVQRRF